MKNFQVIKKFLKPHKDDATWGTSIQKVLDFIKQSREKELSKDELIVFCQNQLYKRNWHLLSTYNWEHLGALIEIINISHVAELQPAAESVDLSSVVLMGGAAETDASPSVSAEEEHEDPNAQSREELSDDEDLTRTEPMGSPGRQEVIVLSSNDDATSSEDEDKPSSPMDLSSSYENQVAEDALERQPSPVAHAMEGVRHKKRPNITAAAAWKEAPSSKKPRMERK